MTCHYTASVLNLFDINRRYLELQKRTFPNPLKNNAIDYLATKLFSLPSFYKLAYLNVLKSVIYPQSLEVRTIS